MTLLQWVLNGVSIPRVKKPLSWGRKGCEPMFELTASEFVDLEDITADDFGYGAIFVTKPWWATEKYQFWMVVGRFDETDPGKSNSFRLRLLWKKGQNNHDFRFCPNDCEFGMEMIFHPQYLMTTHSEQWRVFLPVKTVGKFWEHESFS